MSKIVEIIDQGRTRELTDDELTIAIGQYKVMCNSVYGAKLGSGSVDDDLKLYRTYQKLLGEQSRRNKTKFGEKEGVTVI